MKKSIIIAALSCLFLAACQKPEFVEPTVQRQSITSISAFFTDGPYNGLLLGRLEVSDPDADRFVIPIPYYYPEESDDQTTMYMAKVRVKAELANDCKIDPPLSVMSLYDENEFVFTDASGKSRKIVITGKRVKSSNATLMSFSIVNPPIDGFIDNDERMIYLFTTDDLSSVSATAVASAHASVKSDLDTPADYNNPREVVLLAPDGKTEIVYTAQKAIPTKIAHGFNKSSVRQLFNFAPDSRLGTPAYTAATNPSLAAIDGYLVVCMGDGSTPIYLDGQTGAKKGEIVLGSASAGSIASDEAGNMLICNHIAEDPYSGSLKIYKSSSVSEAPVLFCEYESARALPRGGKMEISGNLDGDAMVTILFEGVPSVTSASHFISIEVKGGTVNSINEYDLSAAGLSWGQAPVNAAALTPASSTAAGGWFFGAYSGLSGGPEIDWVKPDLSIGSNLPTSNGSGWAWNANQIDCKAFNNAQYAALLVLSHFPAWGVAPQLYVYDVTDISGMKGEFDNCSALVVGTEIEYFQMTNAAESNSCGDVVIAQSADGFKVFIYYFDQYAGVIGGFVADCIKK